MLTVFIHSIQLIERFYDPLAGEIYVRLFHQRAEVLSVEQILFFQLDGEHIGELNIQEYRKQLALVSQEPTLYAGTVRSNILLGAVKPQEEVTQDEIEDACRKANILEFIQELPQYVDMPFIYLIVSEMHLPLQGL
jgi:ATP-binding cassette subfamily B (MDR/TAP) protein 1